MVQAVEDLQQQYALLRAIGSSGIFVQIIHDEEKAAIYSRCAQFRQAA
jgi:hypothetical protein